MSDTIKARFVGGPKHNQVIECNRLPCIRVVKPRPVTVSAYFLYEPTPDFSQTFEAEEYTLFRFVSEDGARFSQYVHQSMIRKGEPDRRSFEEPTFCKVTIYLGHQDLWLFREFCSDFRLCS